MGSKQKTRRRMDVQIQSVPKIVKRDEHQICETTGCRNVVAVWSKHRTCSLCRAEIQ